MHTVSGVPKHWWRLWLMCLCVLGHQSVSMAASTSCLIPPAYDPGVGELYVCPPDEGEQHLMAYARRSFTETGLLEDIWANFRGVFGDLVWINVGLREANDTSLPAWTVLSSLVERLRAIKAGDSLALKAFLEPIGASQASTEADRLVQQQLLTVLTTTATVPGAAPLRIVLYHVHLRPTRDIEERSLLPINHVLSIPSHGDLLHVPRLLSLAPDSEAKIAVASGIWTYGWNQAQALRYVTEHYDGPAEVPWSLQFAQVYTRFAITQYHAQGLNDPSALSVERIARYIDTLRPTGAQLRFSMAGDWSTLDASVFRTAMSTSAAEEADLVSAGKAVYEADCAVCHGLRGDGRGMAAHMLLTQPRDFRTAVFKFRSTPSGSLPRDDDLHRILQHGVRRTAMVAQTHLSETERRAVIAYLKTFSPRWRVEEPEAAIIIPDPPPQSMALRTQGRQLYETAGCAQCHGDDGRGDGPQAEKLTDDWGWPIRPANLQQRPFKGGSTLRDIYRTLVTGLDGTPMPVLGDALSPDQVWAAVYYVDALSESSPAPDDNTPVGEEARGMMVERMHGRMGSGRGSMPMMHHMRPRRPGQD